ncbi:universal stress protein [Arthrobacter sp. C152]
MTSDQFKDKPLLVGLMPRQHPEVLQTAAALAAAVGAPMVCAYVDEASYLVDWDPSRSAHRMSLRPDAGVKELRVLAAGLEERIREVVGAAPAGRAAVEWTLRTLTGDPARSLGRLAAEVEAPMIIVGTSERGFSHRLSEALNGSVGAWLSHHQNRPVLVVPYHKAAHEDRP